MPRSGSIYGILVAICFSLSAAIALKLWDIKRGERVVAAWVKNDMLTMAQGNHVKQRNSVFDEERQKLKGLLPVWSQKDCHKS